jgi:hypothetical protein
MSLFEHFFKVLSLYLEARIRIRIKEKGRIRVRIRITVKRKPCFAGSLVNSDLPRSFRNLSAVLWIRNRMFLSLLDLDPDPFISGTGTDQDSSVNKP